MAQCRGLKRTISYRVKRKPLPKEISKTGKKRAVRAIKYQIKQISPPVSPLYVGDCIPKACSPSTTAALPGIRNTGSLQQFRAGFSQKVRYVVSRVRAATYIPMFAAEPTSPKLSHTIPKLAKRRGLYSGTAAVLCCLTLVPVVNSSKFTINTTRLILTVLRTTCAIRTQQASTLPLKNGNRSEVPGSVSGEVELEELLVAFGDLTKFKLEFHAAACAPCPARAGTFVRYSLLLSWTSEFCLGKSLHSLPLPLRLTPPVFALKEAIMLVETTQLVLAQLAGAPPFRGRSISGRGLRPASSRREGRCQNQRTCKGLRTRSHLAASNVKLTEETDRASKSNRVYVATVAPQIFELPSPLPSAAFSAERFTVSRSEAADRQQSIGYQGIRLHCPTLAFDGRVLSFHTAGDAKKNS